MLHTLSIVALIVVGNTSAVTTYSTKNAIVIPNLPSIAKLIVAHSNPVNNDFIFEISLSQVLEYFSIVSEHFYFHTYMHLLYVNNICP